MQIPLLRGRNLSRRDDLQHEQIALVNQGFVRRYFPHTDPIGKEIMEGYGSHERIGDQDGIGRTKAGVIGLVLKQGLSLAIVGLITGLAGAWATTRFHDCLTIRNPAKRRLDFRRNFRAAGAVAILACWIPARRAALVDPTVTMRAE